MKGKTFLGLVVVAGVLAALAYFRFGNETPSGTAKMGAPLFADLKVNQVASVTIADAAHTVSMSKGEAVWQVDERGGYPADFEELRDTLLKLSRLKVGRRFDGSPESLKRLSLLPPAAGSAADGGGKRLTLKDASGTVIADVILGQPRETEGGGSGGQYVKKADENTVFLVDGSFRWLKTEPAEWLQKEILNVSAREVAAVTCFADPTPTPVYSLARPKRGDDPQMDAVPPGRRVDAAKVDQVFDALAPLTVEDVAAADPPGPTTPGPRLVFRLYDGRRITLFPQSTAEDTYTLRLYAEQADAETAAPSADDEPAASGNEAAGAGEPEKAEAPAVKTADQLNRELGPWVFSIKKWQFDSLITGVDGLLEAPKQDDKTS